MLILCTWHLPLRQITIAHGTFIPKSTGYTAGGQKVLLQMSKQWTRIAPAAPLTPTSLTSDQVAAEMEMRQRSALPQHPNQTLLDQTLLVCLLTIDILLLQEPME